MIWQFKPPPASPPTTTPTAIWIDRSSITAVDCSSSSRKLESDNRTRDRRQKQPALRGRRKKVIRKLSNVANVRPPQTSSYRKHVRRRVRKSLLRRARSVGHTHRMLLRSRMQFRNRRHLRSTSSSSYCIGSNDGCTRYRSSQRPASSTFERPSVVLNRRKPVHSYVRRQQPKRTVSKRNYSHHDEPLSSSGVSPSASLLNSTGEKAAHPTSSGNSNNTVKPYGKDESREVDRSLCNYTWVSTVKPVLPSDDVYRMLSWPRGYVLIINNKYFNAEELWTRTGSEVDVLRMRLTFEMLGFKIYRNKTYHDLTAKQADKLLSEFATYEGHRRCDCLAVVTMSHGSKTKGLYFRNGDSIKPEDIHEKFIGEHCPAMRNKPKIFIMNHCRGVALDGGTAHTSSRPTPQLSKHLRTAAHSAAAARRRRQKIVSDDDESVEAVADAADFTPVKRFRFADKLVTELDRAFKIDDEVKNDDDEEENCDEPPPINGQADCDISLGCIGYKTPDNKIARYSDMIVVYSTTLGYVGLRSRELGCFFFDCLANLTAQMSHKEHLIDILTKVNSMQGHFALQVNGEYKYQQSEIVSRLHKKLFFNPGIRERGVSISQSPSAADEDAAASSSNCSKKNNFHDDDSDEEDESGEDEDNSGDDEDFDGRQIR